jgi:hypothetical protein
MAPFKLSYVTIGMTVMIALDVLLLTLILLVHAFAQNADLSNVSSHCIGRKMTVKRKTLKVRRCIFFVADHRPFFFPFHHIIQEFLHFNIRCASYCKCIARGVTRRQLLREPARFLEISMTLPAQFNNNTTTSLFLSLSFLQIGVSDLIFLGIVRCLLLIICSCVSPPRLWPVPLVSAISCAVLISECFWLIFGLVGVANLALTSEYKLLYIGLCTLVSFGEGVTFVLTRRWQRLREQAPLDGAADDNAHWSNSDLRRYSSKIPATNDDPQQPLVVNAAMVNVLNEYIKRREEK